MNIRPARDKVKYIGRAFEYEENAILGFSGSGIEFIAEKGKTAIVFHSDETATDPDKDNEKARTAVYVNGRRVADFMMDEADKKISLNLTEDSNEIKVIKLSENAMSSIAITEIISHTEISKAEDKKILAEFIGDSITCGYAVDDESLEHIFKTSTEDCTKAYAIKTAEILDADAILCSLSGWGIISGYSDDGETRHDEQLMPSVYEKAGFSYTKIYGKDVQDFSWNFDSLRQPDVVVINLGTNDDSYCRDIAERRQWFSKEYVDFLHTVRKRRPDSVIVCTLGIMGRNMCPCVEEAVKVYREETGDAKIYTMMFDEQLEEDGRVVDYHPTAKTHQKAAEKLAAKIKELKNIH